MKTLSTVLALPLVVSTLYSAEPMEVRFGSLFNGEDFSGWSGDGYRIEDGTIVCTPDGKELATNHIFANYAFDFEFRLPPGGNNGIGIHYPGHGAPHVDGMEIQILDDDAEKWKNLKPYQYHGSIYELVPAKRGHLKPAGEWNQERITVFGPKVKVELNGEVITEANLEELAKEHPKRPGVRRRAGQIALLGHGDAVAFRDLKIAELPPAANDQGAAEAGFVRIFDGATLDGWKLEDGGEGHWVPINGILKYDGRSTAKIKDLWTVKPYRDFTLLLDWRWTRHGGKKERPIIAADGSETGKTVEVEELDSGIYLRGNTKSQVNLWNWPVGSGEVYGYRTDKNQTPEVRAGVTPFQNADKPVGEWNRMMITMKGDRLTVVLNGVTVIEDAELPGVPESGPIGLQHHGSAIDFANIWIKEL